MPTPDKANQKKKIKRYTTTISFSCSPELEPALNEVAWDEHEGNRSALITKLVSDYLRARGKMPKQLTRVPRAGRRGGATGS